MHVLEKFLGNGSYPVLLNKTAAQDFLQLYYNDNLCIVCTNDPIPYQDENNSHEHDSYEFTIPLNANPRLRMDKQIFELPNARIVACNPGQNHGPAGIIKNNRMMAIQVDRIYMQEVSKSVYNRQKIIFKNHPIIFDPYLRSLLKKFVDESTLKQAGYGFILHSISVQISIHILRSLDNNSGQPKAMVSPGKKNIRDAIEFLHENYNHEFTLEDLAKAANLSKYYFVRVFKNETGRTPYEYLINYKLEKAQELLRTGKHTVTEVCYLCGFQNHSHFSRCFRQMAGCTPSRYKALFSKDIGY